MKRIIMFVLLFAALKVAGQTTGYLRFDTVKIMKQNGTCELYIINKTKDSLGLLTNVGGGLTQFKRAMAITDSSILIGNDTVILRGATPRFAIEDATSDVDRYISMSSHDFIMDSASAVLLTTYLGGNQTSLLLGTVPRLRNLDIANSIQTDLSVYPSYVQISRNASNTPGKLVIAASDSLHVTLPYKLAVFENDTLKSISASAIATDTTSLSNRINQKLNITDTTNKWINDIRRTPGSLNVEKFKNGSWTTAYTDSAGGSGSSEQIIGQILQQTNFTSLAGFATRGATVSATGGHLAFTGGNPFDQTLDIDSSRSIESWIISAKMKIVATGNGPGLGWRSNSSGGNYSIMGRLNTSNGSLDLWAGTFTQVAVSTSNLSFTVGDTVELTVERDKTISSASVRNVTTNSATITVSYNYLFSSANNLPNTGRLAIFNNGGSFDVDSLSAWSKVATNPSLIIIGDSKFVGYTATSEGYRVGDLLNNYFRSCVILAGGGDKLEDMIKRYKEILAIKGSQTKILLGGCSNNIRAGQSSATYNQLYDSLVTILVNAGCDVYHTTGMYETGINQNTFKNHIYATYSADKIIETLTPTNQPNLLAADNIHLNDAGQRIVFNEIVRSGKITSEATTYDAGNTVLRNQTNDYQPAQFKLLGYGSILASPTTVSPLTLTNTASSGKLIDLNTDHATNTGLLQFSRQGSAQSWLGLGAGLTTGASTNDLTIRHNTGRLLFTNSTGIEEARFDAGKFYINTATSPFSNGYIFAVNQASSSQFVANFEGQRAAGINIGMTVAGTARAFFGIGDGITGAGTNDLYYRSENGVINFGNSATLMMKVNSGELNLGNFTDQGSYTLQNTGGLYQNGTVNLRGVSAPTSTYNVLVHDLTDSTLDQVPLSTITGSVTTLYNGDGSLSGDRTVTGGANGITFTSTRTGTNSTMTVNNTSSGRGINVSSGAGIGVRSVATTGIALQGVSTDNYGLWAQSTTAPGLYVLTSAAQAADLTTNPSSTNTVVPIANLYRTSQSAGASGIGGSIDIYLNNSSGAGTTVLANQIISKLPTATSTSETSQLIIKGRSAGSATTVATFDGNGNATFGTTNSIVGTATNNDALAGNIGEYVSSTIASGSAVALTTTTTANVTSISLTAGDWDVTGVVDYAMTSATATDFKHGVSTTSATLGGQDTYVQKPFAFAGSSSTLTDNTPTTRLSLSGTTTVYLVAQTTFSGGSVGAYGTIRARRVR